LNQLLEASGIDALGKDPTPDGILAALERLVTLSQEVGDLPLATLKSAAIRELEKRHVHGATKLVQEAFANHAAAFQDVEPYPLQISTDEVLGHIREVLQRYVVLTPDQTIAVALFVCLTYVYRDFPIVPLLGIVSPVKGCGKTTLLSLLAKLVHRPLEVVNMTEATLFRAIERLEPTLLIDEADTYVDGKEGLRGVLNSGHRTTGRVLRCGSADSEYGLQLFNVFGPKVIARIGSFHPTLADRSITIEMRKRRQGEEVSRWREDRVPDEVGVVPSFLLAWARDYGGGYLASYEPEIPDTLGDRQQDNWRPLLAIAESAGGEWPAAARKAAEELSVSLTHEPDEPVELLKDVAGWFDGHKDADFVPTVALLDHLNDLDDRLWCSCVNGGVMTPNDLAKRLRPFGVSPRQKRTGGDVVCRGYFLSDLQDAFHRYLGRG
jgi:putative DNA primase/helicase